MINSLTTIRILSPICHANQPFFVNLSPPNILVFKFAVVDACTTGAVSSGDVPALNHEFINDTVKWGELVRQSFRGRFWSV